MSNAANNNDNKNGKRNIVLPHKNNKYDKYDKYKYYDPLLCPPIAIKRLFNKYLHHFLRNI